MVGEERLQSLVEQVLRLSGAEQTEALLLARQSELTRYANSYVHQHVSESHLTLRVRAVEDGRVGMAVTNQLDAESLRHTVEKAQENARIQTPDPDFSSLPSPTCSYPQVQSFFAATVEAEATDRVGLVQQVIAEAGDFTACGYVSTDVTEMAVGNSLGLQAYNASTSAVLRSLIYTDEGSGFASAYSGDISQLDALTVAREATERCARNRCQRDVEPQQFEVILEPYAVAELVRYLAHLSFSGPAVQEGQSAISSRQGQQVVHPAISIWEDGTSPLGCPRPFDLEGVPKRRVELIHEGIAQGAVYDHRSARKYGVEPTGHYHFWEELRSGGGGGAPVPTNLFMAAGDASLEQMIASTSKGIWITRFHYVRPIHTLRTMITGMTRDGAFLVEDGKVRGAIRNLRFTDSILRMLNDVELVGQTRKLDGAFPCQLVPRLKLGSFHFTGKTAH